MNEQQTFKGYTIKLIHDADAANPRREYDDELITMACFHRRYDLGDKHNLSIEEVKEIAESPDYISLPLFLYDHSGITMRTSPFSCSWDSGQVGLIFVSWEKVRTNWSGKDDDQIKEAVIKSLQSVVEEYDAYLTGDCWGYKVIDPKGQEVESCWGFYTTQYAIEEAKTAIEHDIKRLDPAFNGSLGF